MASASLLNGTMEITGPNTSSAKAGMGLVTLGEHGGRVERPVGLAAGEQRGAGGDGVVDDPGDVLELALVDDRAEEYPRLARVAGVDVGGAAGDLGGVPPGEGLPGPGAAAAHAAPFRPPGRAGPGRRGGGLRGSGL